MKIDVILNNRTEYDFSGKTVVVIDVLRATSTILTALVNGCLEVIPVCGVEEALTLRKTTAKGELILGGERKGKTIPGFDLGNSPLEYTKEKVGGRRVVLCTTNGTQALVQTAGAEEVLIGSFLNITKVASYLKETARDITLFCAGREGRMSLEDLLCAGKIIKKILFMAKNGTVPELTDSGRLAMIAYKHLVNKVKGPVIAIAQTEHGQYLSSIGYNEDLRYCGQVDFLPQLAIYQNGSIVLHKPC